MTMVSSLNKNEKWTVFYMFILDKVKINDCSYKKRIIPTFNLFTYLVLVVESYFLFL